MVGGSHDVFMKNKDEKKIRFGAYSKRSYKQVRAKIKKIWEKELPVGEKVISSRP